MRVLAVLALGAAALAAQPPSQFTGETLNYTINWPSGLSLGEGKLTAAKSEDEWRFSLVLDASVPGFTVTDSFRSVANADFCSRQFEKDYTHGKRKADEKTVFDASKGTATRETAKGGKSEIQFSGCPRDALAFVYFVRRELAQGRIPPAQTIYFGSAYQVRLDYSGSMQIKANDRPYSADRFVVGVKGPSSDLTFEMFFARDARRTPVMVRVPLMLGTFSLELAP